MEGAAEDREIEMTLKEDLASEQAAKQARLKEEMEQARLSALNHGTEKNYTRVWISEQPVGTQQFPPSTKWAYDSPHPF
ncbi:hypothetical protein H257_14405 [Aphanomyces astaci]|uniref:Uncharacterized protein n=1 Tax=Aphanomyces astaci TaxID=112090 RepID=W4FRF6_APHAT|nr:hypothetical protein H257_14405 [Aphanomyces astaci]ETV70065.1 hypothetical protein H257_14405 [Aphanomyces astaci]|eukprot:XP_009840508.1 hypothetical protein H257_14405 [Aphanomyces astaci]